MYNRIILVGNLTRDIELRYLPSGTAVGSAGIATNRKWKGQDGQMHEEVMFIDITFFGRQAEIANQYLHKGSKVLVEGRLKLEQWTDTHGGKRSRHIVIVETMKMLDNKSNSNQQPRGDAYGYNGNNDYNYAQAPATQQPQKQEKIPEINIDDEEIPF